MLILSYLRLQPITTRIPLNTHQWLAAIEKIVYAENEKCFTLETDIERQFITKSDLLPKRNIPVKWGTEDYLSESSIKVLISDQPIPLKTPKNSLCVRSGAAGGWEVKCWTMSWIKRSLRALNSYAWGISVRGHFYRFFNCPISLAQNGYTRQGDFNNIYVQYRLPSKFRWTEKNSFLTGRFANFAQKSNSSGCKRLKMTVKLFRIYED